MEKKLDSDYVSVENASHNRGYNKKCVDCWFYDCVFGSCILSECTYRPYRKEPDDLKDDWHPAKSFEEALAIVNANPITPDMSYDERLAAQKRRFGL